MNDNQGYSDNFSNYNQSEFSNHAVFGNLMACIEANDVLSMEDIMNNCPLPVNTRNLLLNKAMLLYIRNNVNNRGVISLLLAFRANPNLKVRFKGKDKDNNNDTYALFIAVESNDMDLVKIFFDHGALPNIKDNIGRNSLFYMLRKQNDAREMCNELIKRGINVNDSDFNGFTPLMEAVNKNKGDIVDILLQAKADVNKVNDKDGNTVIHYSIMNTNKEILKKLMLYKPDITIKNKCGESPLEIITKNQKGAEFVAILLSGSLSLSQDINSINYSGKKLSFTKGKMDSSSNDKDLMFTFPKEKISSRVEIPFVFQDSSQNIDQSGGLNGNGNINQNQSQSQSQTQNQFHSFIKIQKPPTLFLDISNETRQDKFICEGLKTESGNLSKVINKYQETISTTTSENEALKQDLLTLQEELAKSERQLIERNEYMNLKEQERLKECIDCKAKIDHQDVSIQLLLSQFELMKESKAKAYISSEEYNNKKYSTKQFDGSYLNKMLTRDLKDYRLLVKRIINARKAILDHLIFSLQEIINSISMEVSIRIYGSYATGLSIEASNLDLVIVPNSINANINLITLLQSFFIKLQGMPWIISSNLIESFVPILHIQTNEQYNKIEISVSTFSYTHSGLKCAELMIQFMKDYEAFEYLLIATKQILRNSNLISVSNGGLNSYSLTLMIINFLQSYLIEGKDINIGDSNLGKLFLEFLKYYGYTHDLLAKKIITVAIDKAEVKNQEKVITTQPQLVKSQSNELVIIDPLNSENNVAEKTFDFSDVRLAFMISYIVSKDNCECGCHYNCCNSSSSDLNNQDKDHCILNKIFKTVKRFTKQSVK